MTCQVTEAAGAVALVVGCFPSQLEKRDCSSCVLLSPVPARWPSQGLDVDPSIWERRGWDPTEPAAASVGLQ